MAEPAHPEVRYTAFLSYSHKDAAAAGRLHRRLEAYRLPKRLAGSETARGVVPDRLWPIFRDREELPAATDLSETVREALAQSGALIVLCSPHAAGSLWVAEEIETFRRLHPDRPILAAILDGDPPNCFPAALRAFGQDGTWHEPLATDLRRGRDGAQLGLLKLVAGITGVKLDALVQRDSARRIRRATALTIGVTIALLAMTALALFALRARAEADRQRTEAEDLVQFMLTDVHPRLEGVGRLPIMRAVTERALAHYDLQIRRGDRSTRTLLQRARVLQRLAEQDILQSEMATARARVTEAREITAAALREAPDDPDRIFAHAQSDYWLGRLHELGGDWRSAGLFYQAYSSAAERLVATSPSSPDYMMERAYAASHLGAAKLSGGGDPIAARTQFLISIRWFGAASRARPADDTARLRLANAFANLADSYWASRSWRDALDARRRQMAILTPLHRADPARLDIFFNFAAGQNGLARALRQVGDRQASLALLGETLASAHRLTGLDPSNGEWLVFQTIVQCELLMGPGPPPGMRRTDLVKEFRQGMAALRAQANPRRALFAGCERAAR
ncbi:MAG TPA: toll/interleukin-1 receptor domain-containing protein [Allosphingosinicella sp.]|nr:toll/interleukin-1 receptor domain-containing protein [Allosphingosinicella sp.]